MDGVTLGIALLGAALGLVNTWWSLYRDRVRLVARPIWCGKVVGQLEGRQLLRTSVYPNVLDLFPDGQFGIEIINRGFISVTVTGAGLTRSGFFGRMKTATLKRRAIASSALGDVSFPIELKPRSSVMIWASGKGAAIDEELRGVKRVYVSTACGLDVFGTTRMLKRLASGRRVGDQKT